MSKDFEILGTGKLERLQLPACLVLLNGGVEDLNCEELKDYQPSRDDCCVLKMPTNTIRIINRRKKWLEEDMLLAEPGW